MPTVQLSCDAQDQLESIVFRLYLLHIARSYILQSSHSPAKKKIQNQPGGTSSPTPPNCEFRRADSLIDCEYLTSPSIRRACATRRNSISTKHVALVASRGELLPEPLLGYLEMKLKFVLTDCVACLRSRHQYAFPLREFLSPVEQQHGQRRYGQWR